MNQRLIKLIKEEFEKIISTKTGWGKNEVLSALDKATSIAAIKLLDEKEKQ